MDSFLGILFLIIYLFAAASGSKKKKEKRKQRQAERRNRDVAFGDAFGSAQEKQPAAAPVQSAQMERGRADLSAAHEGCVQQRIHLHEVPQSEMYEAGEGEDPCHAGQAPQPEDLPQANAFEQSEAAEWNEFSRDVLRGVIMSEILTRPCDRVAYGRKRRSAG